MFDCEDLPQRIGILTIGLETIRNDAEGRELMGLLYTRVAPIHATYDWPQRRMMLRCMSPEFEVRDTKLDVPRYNAIITRTSDRDRYFHILRFEKA